MQKSGKMQNAKNVKKRCSRNTAAKLRSKALPGPGPAEKLVTALKEADLQLGHFLQALLLGKNVSLTNA